MPFRDALFWISAALCLIAQLAIVRSAIVSPVTPAESPAAGRRVAEIAWAVLPGLALVALFVFTWRAMHPAVAL